ncbi:scopoletin glucosyltransferase-like [Iris pallida]|uniref:Scopoletin glucosyltransferase-like n=1 Tax=Iris pallida TaxID=29817 RepID=A0AAX6FDD2_IRIPA|nr:scopoletin glucosyltransferase-like [Iris pallida]
MSVTTQSTGRSSLRTHSNGPRSLAKARENLVTRAGISCEGMEERFSHPSGRPVSEGNGTSRRRIGWRRSERLARSMDGCTRAALAGGGEDGGLDATDGKELGHVEHRENVAWCQEGEEEHAETTTTAATVAFHGWLSLCRVDEVVFVSWT